MIDYDLFRSFSTMITAVRGRIIRSTSVATRVTALHDAPTDVPPQA